MDIKNILSKHGWRGDLKPAIRQIRKLKKLSRNDNKIKKQFLGRFYEKNDCSTIKSRDPFVLDIIAAYQNYWMNMLMGKIPKDKGEGHLSENIKSVLKKYKINYWKSRKIDSLKKYIEKEFKKRGLFYLIGNVLPYRELEIWRKQTTKYYDVKLPTKIRKVKVVFLEKFIIRGWADYATTGVTYPGGWAKKNALFCVKDVYDLRKEIFKISYLVHEGQHFDDYKYYPKLEQIDLEYRAKLAELLMANKIMFQLLNKFLVTVLDKREFPHPYASFCLCRDLSLAIFNKKMIKDMKKWKRIPAQKIKDACLQLYNCHTDGLKKAGAKRVKSIL